MVIFEIPLGNLITVKYEVGIDGYLKKKNKPIGIFSSLSA